MKNYVLAWKFTGVAIRRTETPRAHHSTGDGYGWKDGTIRAVFDGVNPQGVKVASFKVPTPEELAHDYLWRIHKHTPGKVKLLFSIVLITKMSSLSESISLFRKSMGKRFEHINNFEHMLADEGTTILKFYLHIDR